MENLYMHNLENLKEKNNLLIFQFKLFNRINVIKNRFPKTSLTPNGKKA